MKIKRMVKRLLAVGTGATMLGATAMGAMAADLSNYPDMFVTDGTFNGFLVVGENAAAIDNLAMTDIAASMKYSAGTAATTTTVEGDSWLISTSSKKLEVSNSNQSSSTVDGETFRDINTFIGDEELDGLADGTWSTNENEYDFQQFMYLDSEPTGVSPADNRIVKYVENDDDETDVHLFFKSAREIARYVLEFSSTAQSDITDSDGTSDTTGTYLDDFEDTEISFFGNTYSVVQARRPSATVQHSIKLILMAGSTRDTLLEGESKTYTIGETEYDVMLSFVDSDEGKFTINGEATNKLKVGETYQLSDGSEVGVSEVLYQDYAGGVHSVTFYLGASKMELRDDNVNTAGGSYNMKVGSEDIDGTTVAISGTDDNTTFTVTDIQLNMSAEDDFFVGPGEKLSDVIAAAGEESEALFNGGWDIEYHGLTAETTHELALKSSSSRRYKLHLFDGDNNEVSIPIAYAESTTNITMGEESAAGSNSRDGAKRLILNESHWIYKNDYFVLTGGTASEGSAVSYLLQYKGADRHTKTSPKIQFKNMGNGETLEYSVSTGSSVYTNIATIKLGGHSFIVENFSSTGSDDFQVRVDMDAGGDVERAASAGDSGDLIPFVDYYGSQWDFAYFHAASGTESQINNTEVLYKNVTAIQLIQTTPNADDYDTVRPTNLALNISSTSGPELRAAILTAETYAGTNVAPGYTLVTPDGETEVSYGYSSLGTKITLEEPASDPDELFMEYPDAQRLPQAYITTGSTTTSTSSTGDLTAVTVVDATKLDSEIASVSAQNLIAIGGPCVNTVAAELLGNPADCTEGFTPGKARVKLFENANGNMAMLVAGYSGADTRLAGKVIAHRYSEMTGMEVEVEGTTYSDATIAAPATG